VPTSVAGSYAGRWFDRVHGGHPPSRGQGTPRLHSRPAAFTIRRSGTRASLFAVDPGWLPAIEVMGEAFILNSMTTWSERGKDGDCCRSRRQGRRQLSSKVRGVRQTADRTITPRFLLVHTLAHLLINQWSLECGYPTASLRERVYADGQMAGILIYTATSDSAGSLGGIVALADPDRLATALAETLQRAGWCSSDPLCSESKAPASTHSTSRRVMHASCSQKSAANG